MQRAAKAGADWPLRAPSRSASQTDVRRTVGGRYNRGQCRLRSLRRWSISPQGAPRSSREQWEEAKRAFERLLTVEETPEALEGLGLAAWGLDRADVVFDSRERAFRGYRSRGDHVSQELLSRIERSGEAFLSNAMVRGRFALRACIVNFRTSQADIEALLPLLSRLGAETDRALRLIAEA